MTKIVAILDAEAALIGIEEVSDAEARDRVVVPPNIDLPLDGTYKWVGDHFVPLGYEFGKPTPPQISPDHASYLFMRAQLDGTPIPAEVHIYADWYRDTILPRVEEKRIGDKRRSAIAAKPRGPK